MIMNKVDNKSFDVVSSFQGDPFVGHLSTPITTSSLTKTYLSLLPAYKSGLSPLLRGLNIGFAHGYLLLGPFTKLGPLRDSQVAGYVGLLSALALIIILTGCLIIYGSVTFSAKKEAAAKETVSKVLSTQKNEMAELLSVKGWGQFVSGFILGGFGGVSVAYVILKAIAFNS